MSRNPTTALGDGKLLTPEDVRIASIVRVEIVLDLWERWIDTTLDTDGDWYMGWCPLHDAKKVSIGSGLYNPVSSVFKCTNYPRCHTARGMTLQNLGKEIIRRGIH